jgi:homopolymeric O-antigen transport system permease protein
VLLSLWRHRSFVLAGALHELKQRYAGSALGVLWHVVTPLAQILVYYAVFSRFMSARSDTPTGGAYALFLCAGILPWFVFAESVTRGGGSLLANEGYLKKLPVPETVFVARSVATSTLTLGLYTIALVAMALLAGVRPHAGWLLLPGVLALFVCFCFGIALVLSVVMVFFRDVAQIVAIVLQFWFWLTPVVYHPTALGPRLSMVMDQNPVTPFILGVRGLLVYGTAPEAAQWAWMAAWAGGLCLAGALMIDRLRSDLRDAL